MEKMAETAASGELEVSRASRKVLDILTREEVDALLSRSDLRGAFSVATSWGMIAGAFVLVSWRLNVLTVMCALVILGGRQLALAILMHEASHRSLFRSRFLNDHLGTWLCAAPIWQSLERYRVHHMAHHTHTGTERDTDLGLVTPFPTSRRSLVRKFVRDLLGISGIKRVYGLLLMDLGFIEYTASVDVRPIEQTGRGVWDVVKMGWQNLRGVLGTNLVLFGVLAWSGHPGLYLLWVWSYLTTFSLFLRIRSIAEHACTSKTSELFLNTRTTYAGWLARITVAPHFVNYHLEHHLLMMVPHYHLARMHGILRERGALEGSPVAGGYLEVLGRVIRTLPEEQASS